MSWPAPVEEPVVETIILEDKSIVKSAAQRWAREKEGKVGAGVWMWWTDVSSSDDGRVGAAAVCKYCNEWRSHRSYQGTGRMEVCNAVLWVIGLALGERSTGEQDCKSSEIKRWQSLATHKPQFEKRHTESPAPARD
jgi:hypothetical protein